jgi:hypothetical protein
VLLQYTGKASVIRYGAVTGAAYDFTPGSCLLADIRDAAHWLTPLKFDQKPTFRIATNGSFSQTDQT